MDLRASHIVLVVAVIAIAWLSKSYWGPKASHTANSILSHDNTQTQEVSLQEYSKDP